jgi:hypothetical protein
MLLFNYQYGIFLNKETCCKSFQDISVPKILAADSLFYAMVIYRRRKGVEIKVHWIHCRTWAFDGIISFTIRRIGKNV